MKNIFETNIYYADTDAYGVVWHGAYLRWMEKGRCDFSEALGFNLAELVKQDIALPVANMNVKFGHPSVNQTKIFGKGSRHFTFFLLCSKISLFNHLKR